MAKDNERERDWKRIEDGEEESSGRESEEEEEDARSRFRAKRRRIERKDSSSSEDNDEGASSEDADSDKEKKEKDRKEARAPPPAKEDDTLITNPSRLKPLTKEQLVASKAAAAKTGVVYLSRIPPFMKPMKVKDLLSRFGPVGRVFLAPEDPKARARRVKYGGNKKRNFEEGWVEYLNKKHAKLAAETLNTTTIGGKKNGFYHDDLWNIKYLPKFKWHHLQAQIAYENASRRAKLRAEIAKETRVNKTYLRNYERAKMVDKMQEAKKRKRIEEGEGDGTAEKVELRRHFRQHKPKGSAAEGPGRDKAERVKNIFSSVF